MKSPSALAHAPSLAQHLSRTLILAVVVVWLLSTGLVAWLVDRQIQHNFDVELVESTHRQLYPALLDLQQRHRPDATGAYRAADARGEALEPQVMGAIPGDSQAEPLLMQLRDAQGGVLLRTPASPAAAFAVPLQAGFFNTPEYRVFSLYDATHNVWLQLADPLEERSEASERTLLGLVAVLLVMLPVLAWLIHWIARRELRTVLHLQQQITARSGSNLQALDLAHMPLELRAVGDGVNQLLVRLGEALNVERSLAANAAHELRTPLAQVRLRLQTALDQAQPHPAGADGDCVPVAEVRAALQSLETLSHRTERLLQLSRAEGADGAHFARVDLVRLADQVAQAFWQQPQAHKRLDWLPPETDAPVWVRGDIDALAIVLRNLIDNALHHTDAQVDLQVLPGAHPALVVRDHGRGLTTAQLAQIQVRHARIDSQHVGYGLGMSIVRTLADKHGAQLVFASPPAGCAHGLEVRLVFPRTDAPSPLPSTAPPHARA
jgi:two-component system OmpR family sensor kinase